MTPVFVVFTFFNIWCLTWLIMLPFGVRHVENDDPAVYKAAPEKPYIRKKLLWNTVAAVIVTLIIYLIVESGAIPLRDAMQ